MTMHQRRPAQLSLPKEEARLTELLGGLAAIPPAADFLPLLVSTMQGETHRLDVDILRTLSSAAA